jgi:protein involved in polysaccharide export with SLBB domain
MVFAVAGCSASRQAEPEPAREMPQFSIKEREARAKLDTQVCSNPKIVDIWKARMETEGEFTLGPGDVLQITTPGVSELKDRVVRLDAKGNALLPLIGEIKLAGLTEKEAKEAIERKLGDYMYHPQVTVFVQSYHSRQVAVVGAVANPGILTLNPDDTIGSIIQRAGGMSRDAAQEVLFTPASTAGDEKDSAAPAREGAWLEKKGAVHAAFADDPQGAVVPVFAKTGSATSPGASPSPSTAPPAQPEHSLYSTEQPVLINLVSAGGRGCLGVPLRPGDQIDVPLGGTVKVIGWVASPKPIQLTPGLTALGAVAAAGGPLFAADMNNVEVIRQGHNQQAQIIKVNLNKVKELKEPDVVLESNDVIQVPYSIVKLPGYAVYYATVAVIQFAPAALIVSGVP